MFHTIISVPYKKELDYIDCLYFVLSGHSNSLCLQANNQCCVVPVNLAKHCQSTEVSAHIFIQQCPVKCNSMFWRPGPAQHGPVPSNHSTIGGLASAATPSSPPTLSPNNIQTAPDKLERVSHSSVHCTALNARETTTRIKAHERQREHSQFLPLPAVSSPSSFPFTLLFLTQPLSLFTRLVFSLLHAHSHHKRCLHYISAPLAVSCSEINQGLSSHLLTSSSPRYVSAKCSGRASAKGTNGREECSARGETCTEGRRESALEKWVGKLKSDGCGNGEGLFRQNKKEGGMETDGKR